MRDEATLPSAPTPAQVRVPPPAARGTMLLYLAAIVVLFGFGAPFAGLIDVPLSFLLKNKLHLSASGAAGFRLLASAPLYVSFLFGFARDIWDPLRMGDRGFLVLFGALGAAAYLTFALLPATYPSLVVAIMLTGVAFLFILSAQSGLASMIGQQNQMSGQVSAVWNGFSYIPSLAAFLVGGALSDRLERGSTDQAAHALFLVGAGISSLVALVGLWRPRGVFDHLRSERRAVARPLSDVKRLFRHWPIYPALLIFLLWNFSPGSATPLQYYLQNTLHARDNQWGEWNAIQTAAFIPAFALYGVLCQRVRLRTLLIWGTIVATPQMIPLLFIRSVNEALIAAAPMGLMGGVATAAYMDLLIRSCPRGLQGATLMMSGGLYFIAVRFGDVLGTGLYQAYGGFGVCVAAITLVYASILPALLLVPKHLIATSDGELPADVEGGVV